jgi:hypothetical protein
MMVFPAQDIRGVLDSSAIQSYARGHVHVGEMVTEIADEKALFGIPATALLDAHSRFLGDAVARARMGVLVGLPGARLMDLNADAAVEVADVVPLTGNDLARAHAAWAALTHAALLFSTEPERAAGAVGKDRIIAIPTEDA